MRSTETGPAEPTTAGRLRSVLAAAGSLTITTDGHRCDLIGRHAVDHSGRLWLRIPAGCLLAARAARAPRGITAALLEFTDVAPLAVRNRVRARAQLSGWLTAEGTEREAGGDEAGDVLLRLDPARATLDTGDGPVGVALDELVLADPDPLAAEEAGLLAWLADDRLDLTARLTRLVDARHRHAVCRVRPLALDQYAITLRLEYARTYRDVRLPFPAPAHDPAEVGERLRTLLAATRNCPRRWAARP